MFYKKLLMSYKFLKSAQKVLLMYLQFNYLWLHSDTSQPNAYVNLAFHKPSGGQK